MRDENYIARGATKAIDIDFSISVPSSTWFVAVNMLLEFTTTG